ncbi:AAA family ATPase [Antarcticibacterium arcticum]|uniref:AAA family ATPase n=1 Tax=Antarcticibacterium arcticum TaxID=2585771 RepID=A0A5B8YFK5_9FLAO|nr:AAA family ATPase [Antarcticibacterium arcticum]QED36695.1 AAA family ATPase [Antarcticibacterium arcticum]
MSIFNHFSNLDLKTDQQIAIGKLGAFLTSEEEIFILQGYAGSGKTTLLKGVTDYLKAQKVQTLLMAPTGRAAKVLREKVGNAHTIHKTIYNLSAIELKDDKEDAGKSIKYKFPLDDCPVKTVLIIDEASMVSSMESHHEIFTFGTGNLLDDLLTFSSLPGSGNKIIFVGDPAQLPPVGDPDSKALESDYFIKKGFKVETAVLQQVIRHEDNGILINATKIRGLLEKEKRSRLELFYDEHSFIKISNTEIANKYVAENPIPELGCGVIICYSNEQSLNYNRSIREKIYPGEKDVLPGDLLIIGNNNYHSYGTEIMNGDMAKVMENDEQIISRRNIPVYDTVNGKRVKKHVNLDFRKILIRLENLAVEIPCYIIDSLLNSPARDLSLLEMKAIYIDFVMRFNSEQERKKQLGQAFYKEGSEEFKQQLKTDPYYNALRVKYAYAITCHKAQGGEWDTTFVDYFGRTSLKNDPLKWSYTATTRARKKCYAANAPHLSDFSNFNISQIGNLTRVPEEYFDLSQVPLSPFHHSHDHLGKSMKYWEIEEKLKETPFQIIAVNTKDYLERYQINYMNKNIVVDGIHNGAGIFHDFTLKDPVNEDDETELLKNLNAPYQQVFNIDYKPDSPFLVRLYSLIQMACDECGVAITNVDERRSNYMVNYYLKTDAKAALIQFYFNKNDQITRAMPKSTKGNNDLKLMVLVSKLTALTSQLIEVNN